MGGGAVDMEGNLLHSFDYPGLVGRINKAEDIGDVKPVPGDADVGGDY